MNSQFNLGLALVMVIIEAASPFWADLAIFFKHHQRRNIPDPLWKKLKNDASTNKLFWTSLNKFLFKL